MKENSVLSIIKLDGKEKLVLNVKDTNITLKSASFLKRLFCRFFPYVLFYTVFLYLFRNEFDKVTILQYYCGATVFTFIVLFFSCATNTYTIFFQNDELVFRTVFSNKEDRFKIIDNPRMYINKQIVKRRHYYDKYYVWHFLDRDKEVAIPVKIFEEKDFDEFINNFIYVDIESVNSGIPTNSLLEHEYNYNYIVENKQIKVSKIKKTNTKLKIKIRPSAFLLFIILICIIFGLVGLVFIYIFLFGGPNLPKEEAAVIIIFSIVAEAIFLYFYFRYLDLCFIKVKYGTDYLIINRKKFNIIEEDIVSNTRLHNNCDMYFFIKPFQQSIFDNLISTSYQTPVGTSKNKYRLMVCIGNKKKVVLRSVPDSKIIMKIFENCEYTLHRTDIL